jgi:hypothetical protein
MPSVSSFVVMLNVIILNIVVPFGIRKTIYDKLSHIIQHKNALAYCSSGFKLTNILTIILRLNLSTGILKTSYEHFTTTI